MGLIGYARVSTAEARQVLDRQFDALNAAGCERVFEDHACSAAFERPKLAACPDYLHRTTSACTGDKSTSSPASTVTRYALLGPASRMCLPCRLPANTMCGRSRRTQR